MTARSRTWSRAFLTRTAALIVGVGLVLAAIAGGVRSGSTPDRPLVPEPILLSGDGAPEEPPDPRSWLDPWLASEDTDAGKRIDAIPWILAQPATGGAPGLLAALERSMPDEAARAVPELLVRAQSGDDEALARLTALADEDEPPRCANLALGHTMLFSAERAERYEREARLHDSDRARRHALQTHAALLATDDLTRLLSDPSYAAVADARIPYVLALQRLDWVGMLLWVGPAQHASVSPTFIVLGVASGLIWLFFLAYAGDVRSWRSARLALCVVALVLGAASTIPTLVLDVWMEEILGVQRSMTLRGGLAYFVASVGLREELCKFLLFLPLAPFVIRRGDPLEMLIVPGCVGLGFAAEENISYFASSGGASAAGRFLTANFGHVVDTGLIGFAFCRAWREPGRITDFFITFLLVVIGHGLYDALILVPDLSPFSMFSATIYVAVAFFFFGLLRRHASSTPRSVPLTAVFVYGLATLLALTVIGASFELGFGEALRVMIPGTLGAALFVFVFFRQFDEPLLP